MARNSAGSLSLGQDQSTPAEFGIRKIWNHETHEIHEKGMESGFCFRVFRVFSWFPLLFKIKIHLQKCGCARAGNTKQPDTKTGGVSWRLFTQTRASGSWGPASRFTKKWVAD